MNDTEQQIDDLTNQMVRKRNWFNSYYMEHEQKFRRFLALRIGDSEEVKTELLALYNEAETTRHEIQEIEEQIESLKQKIKENE